MRARQQLLASILCVATLGASSARSSADASAPPIPVMDLRASLGRVGASAANQVSPARAGFSALRAGGVRGVVMPLPGAGQEPPASALGTYRALQTWLAASEQFELLGACRQEGRISTWFVLEDPDELAANPTGIGLWVERGARLFALVRSRDSVLASSALAPPGTLVSGLSERGRDVVRRIFEQGAFVDLSHASTLTLDEVVQMAKAAQQPVVASHANARALTEHPFNLSDSQLADIASTGGLVGVTFERAQLSRGRDANIHDVVRHVRHLIQVMGVDHVALGSGFETAPGPPTDLTSAARFPQLARALAQAGLSGAEIGKVFHGNVERLLCAHRH